MDLLKTPSVQSLLDSDLESVSSLPYLDIEELDEVEYALPASEAPTLEEVLSVDLDENGVDNEYIKSEEEPATCSALQVDFVLAVSQQIKQAQERSSAGAATALGVGTGDKLTVGTAQGQLLSFHDQTLRWVCKANVDSSGAIASIAYNKDSSRLLAGFARGLICQYESSQGTIMRRITLGGEIWGILRVTWAASSGLALDTGGSVWLMKFTRPLGVRSTRSSCLFSGARGEVVTMSARCARVLALATLTRLIIVAGGRAAGMRLTGPPETLPVIEWSETDDKSLVCARATTVQMLTLTITGTSISMSIVHRIELNTIPLWLGWLGGSVAIFDKDENLRLFGDDYHKPLELSHIEPVYASAFFKGHWIDGRVSRAMCVAGGSALAGACVVDGALSLLGRRGIVRVRPRDLLSRAQAFYSAGRHLQALRLLSTTHGPDAKSLAGKLIANISERPHILSTKNVADQVVRLCVKYDLGEELWCMLWEQCCAEQCFVEAVGDAAVRGELVNIPPSPDSTQALIERLADFEPTLVERVVASVPLTSLDPHRAFSFTRERGLWRGVGAIAAAIGGWSSALSELSAHVELSCGGGGACRCAGSALVLGAADALAGRAAGGRALPDHSRPSARHDALHALLDEVCSSALVLGAADALAGRAAGGRALPDHSRPSARHDALHALLDEVCSSALSELSAHVELSCGGGGACRCAGSALVLGAADALAGRAAGGRALPNHSRPSARHDALHALLDEVCSSALVLGAADALAGRAAGGRALPDHSRPSARHYALHALLDEGSRGVSPLHTMVVHETGAALRLLEQCARDPPFAGPLAKHNRLRVARALLAVTSRTQLDNCDRVEILEFLTGQLNTGALPPERGLVTDLFELAGGAEGARADRAWLALQARAPDRAPPAPPRARLQWRSAATLPAALEAFSAIEDRCEADLDELFEHVRAHASAAELGALLPALAELRPRAAAALLPDPLCEASVAAALASAAPACALALGDELRAAGRLRGEAGAAHLRNLCLQRPAAAVRAFLAEGVVRPERALAVVREAGARDAEPACLEAAGDPEGALDALLRLEASAEPGRRAELAAEAGALCARAAPTVPAARAADMWRRLMRGAGERSPALLLEALAYLPAEEALSAAGATRAAALSAAAAAAAGARLWACVRRAAGREAHAGVARALAAAGRGLAVRGACVRCGGALGARAAARTGHCARAVHADCAPEESCGACGRRVPERAVSLAPRLARLDAPVGLELVLTAPPRPDLEGV